MAFDYQVGSRGSLLWTSGSSPKVVSGEISAVDADGVSFRPQVDGEAAPTVGERVVLSLDGPPAVRVTAKVITVGGGAVGLLPGSFQHYSRRDYPRVDAPVALVYQLVHAGDSTLSDKAIAAISGWSRPLASEVNLAVNGVAFMSPYKIPEGSELGLKLRIPDVLDAEFEVKAQVVRVISPEEDDDDTGHRIAVRFMDLDPSVRDAFVDYTLRQQDEALGLTTES